MPNHSGIAHAGSGFNLDSQNAFLLLHCGHCSTRGSCSVIAFTNEAGEPRVYWVRCTNCQKGSVIVDGVTHPGAMPADDLEGLPHEVEETYNEARRSFSVVAYTGCELLCRKLLMHVAVDVADAEEGESFASYVAALQAKGYITPPMTPWVDRIRENANESTHELPPPSRERAEMTLSFTMQLLRIVYEMKYQAEKGSALEERE